MSPSDSSDDPVTPWVVRLAPFQGPAHENLVMSITGLAQVGPRPDLATGVSRDTWPRLRQALLERGLMHEHDFGDGGRPGLVFSEQLLDLARETLAQETLSHETLASAETGDNARSQMLRHYRRHYFQYAGHLKKLHSRDPERALSLARFDADNLLAAARQTLDAGEEFGGEFAGRLATLSEALRETARNTAAFDDLVERAAQSEGRVGGITWIQNRTRAVMADMSSGDFERARTSLLELLDHTPADDPVTTAAQLSWLGRCEAALERFDDARQRFEGALRLRDRLATTEAGRQTLCDCSEDHLRLLLAMEDIPTAEIIDALREWLNRLTPHAGGEVAASRAWYLARELSGEGRAAHVADHALNRAVEILEHTRHGVALLSDTADFIEAAIADAGRGVSPALDALLKDGEEQGWTEGARAIRAIADGERDLASLCGGTGDGPHQGLDLDDALIVYAVLRGSSFD